MSGVTLAKTLRAPALATRQPDTRDGFDVLAHDQDAPSIFGRAPAGKFFTASSTTAVVLAQAFVAMQALQRAPLRAREPELRRAAVEIHAHEPTEVDYEQGEFSCPGHCGRGYYCLGR